MPISADSAKSLDQVKQTGKPSKFVLISRGAKVLSVVVYRKGSDDARLREAKDGGKGTISCGVVDGKGSGLSFKLRRADGYNEPPVKASALKEFCNEGNKLNLLPTIEIVDVLPEVEMD